MSWRRPDDGAPCADLAQERSALVDGSLDVASQELLLAHLVHCTPCRLEVQDLRHLRAALRVPPSAVAPSSLAQRLVSIAGTEASLPLWTRPFRRTRPGCLTSRRRSRRLRRAAAAMATAVTVAGVSAAGYLAAPVSTVAPVPHPAEDARAEFGSMLAQLPLANGALAAVLAAEPADLSTPVPVPGAFSATAGRHPLSAGQARAALARAAGATGAVSYSGLQAFRAQSRGRTYSATVEVRAIVGQGTRSRVLDRTGVQVGAGSTPPVSAARLTDRTLSALLERNYTLAAWAGAEAAGRPATVVAAQRAGRTSARWWVDDASGIVLAQQSFDSRGVPVMQVGFTSVQVSRSAPLLGDLPVGLVVPTTDTVLTLSATAELSRQGWFCHDEVAALSLVRVRSDSVTSPGALHLLYSDGLAAVSVLEQRGRLAAAPPDATWDAGLGAHVRDGASSLASWQSGERVFTVVTDGPAELLAAAVAALPHDPPQRRSTMDRIRAGWAEILADMKG